MKQAKKIPVPNVLIDDKSISPKATYLYVMLREIASFKTGKVEVNKNRLMKRLSWLDNRTLKKYCKVLKDIGLVNYDFDALPTYDLLEIELPIQKKKFEYINADVLHKLLSAEGVEVETLVRLYLLYKRYTHEEYKYCWLSYYDVIQKLSTSYSTIATLNRKLAELQVIKIEKGKVKRNQDDFYFKERNKYHLI